MSTAKENDYYVNFTKVLSNAENAILTTSYNNDYIASGNCFTANKTVTIASGTTKYLTFDPTPCKAAEKFCVIIAPVYTTTKGYVEVNIYQGTNYAGGTSVPLVNRSAESSNTALSTLKENTTGTTKGTLGFQVLVGSDSTNQASGGGSMSLSEPYHVNRDNKYLFEFINQSGSEIKFNYRGLIYEI